MLFLKKDVSFIGDIESHKNVIIMGEVEGDIKTDKNLFILDSARLHSNVMADNIQINGVVEGHIKASGDILINKEARVFGDIQCKSLKMESGAIYCGDLKIVDSN